MRQRADDDDYTLMDRDFNEFIRRGLEEKEWESKNEQRRKGERR